MSTPPSAVSASAVPQPVLVEPTKKRGPDGRVREVSVPKFAPVVERGSLAEIPFDNAREAPGDPVSRKDAEGAWRDVSAAEFAAEVLAVAKGLMAEGLGAGDRVAIMARTTYEWTLLDFASWAAGLVTVPIYPTSSAFQARWILQNSGAVACAVETKEQGRLISQERKQLGDLAHLWQFDTGAIGGLKSLGRDIPDAAVAARRATLEPHSPATLIYTSGTTGRPKGCVLTHGNFSAEVDDAIELLHPVFKSVSKDPASTLLFLPFPTCSAGWGDRLHAGEGPPGPRPLHPDGRPPGRPGGLPPHVPAGHPVRPGEGLQHGPGDRGEDGPRLVVRPRGADRPAVRQGGRGRRTRYGPGPGPRPARGPRPLRSAGLPPHPGGAGRQGPVRDLRRLPAGRRLAAFYEGAGIGIFEGYGLTETTAAHTVTPPLKPRLGTVGWPLPGTSVRIAEDGEVLLRGGQVFRGYWDGERAEVARRCWRTTGSRRATWARWTRTAT
ncbi:long-chain acyl-CoA synthetase [Streptomyces badius]